MILELTTLILRINYPGLNKEALLPVPFSELKECRQAEANRFEKWLAALRGYQEVPQARYCEDDMVALQAFGIGLMKLLFEGVILMVNFVFFFDVPVSFFTGQFNPDNGILEPKPFFPRWIVPGVLLQMIVNPQMDTVAEIIATIVSVSAECRDISCYDQWDSSATQLLHLCVCRKYVTSDPSEFSVGRLLCSFPCLSISLARHRACGPSL